MMILMVPIKTGKKEKEMIQIQMMDIDRLTVNDHTIVDLSFMEIFQHLIFLTIRPSTLKKF